VTISEPHTDDRILDGQVCLRQSQHGYRAGMDAVLLGASLQASRGTLLAEFGCGPGAAMLCAALRLADSRFMGVEVDDEAAILARVNVDENAMNDRIKILSADIADWVPEERPQQIFFNPPFFDDPDSLRAPKPEKTRAWISGDTPLDTWVQSAARCLAAKGRLTLIHRADKLPDIMASLSDRFGSIILKPIQSRSNQAAKRIIVAARLSGRSPMKLLPPLILHDDSDNVHTAEADAILRGRAVIDLS
jgi:tRNA1(Val) A37 N6-methylase TrmN6